MSSKIIDACSLINLFASGRVIDVLQAFGGEFYVPKQVKEEALSVRRVDEEDPTRLVNEPIDLDGVIGHGVLKECVIEDEDEAEAFLQFAVDLEDGEAACLAIAKVRDWSVATDDKKAIRLAGKEGITIVTTPELMQAWVEADQPTMDELRLALQNIELYARFRLGPSALFYQWWKKYSVE